MRRTLPVSEKIKYLIIDLPKFIKTHKAIDTRESFWLHLIALGVEAMPPTNDPIFLQAIDNLRIINASQELLDKQVEEMTYNYSHYIDDCEAILTDLVNDTRSREREKLAHDMLVDNEPIEKIIRYSQLSEKEVLEIKSKLDSNT